MIAASVAGVTTGVIGSSWRATISPSGAIASEAGVVDWYVAAADRWYRPAEEASVRQIRLEGTPVVETRLRIPGGDAVQRVYSVADAGGLTVIEIDNESPEPIVVAFDRDDLLTERAPSAVPVAGLELPGGATVVPIGHRSSARVAIAHRRAASADRLPPRLPSAEQVVRGWRTRVDRASRLEFPSADARWADQVVARRCDLLLGASSIPGGALREFDDAVRSVIAIGELDRLGEAVDELLPDLVEAIAVIGRASEQRPWSRFERWCAAAAFDSAERVLVAAGEDRAVRDLARIQPIAQQPLDGPTHHGASSEEPASLDGIVVVPWAEQHGAHRGALLPAGLRAGWSGADFEVHGLPIGPASTISYAVRWHGPRPAVLWETSGEPVTLTSPVLAPRWTSAASAGEALWPPVDALADEQVSFG